jgi:hypothetical protein
VKHAHFEPSFHPRALEGRKRPSHGRSRSTATGIRTPVSAVRGRRPSPLDDGGETRVRVAATATEAVQRSWEHMFDMHGVEIRHRALDLIAVGVNDCEVSRRLGIPRTTVRHWRWAKERDSPDRALCWRCWQPTRRIALTAADYAELLGLYLGDGHISTMPRSERLRLSLDAKYPRIVSDAEKLLGRVFPQSRVGRVIADGGATIVLWVYHRHLSCVLPQHGPAGSTSARSSSSRGTASSWRRPRGRSCAGASAPMDARSSIEPGPMPI